MRSVLAFGLAITLTRVIAGPVQVPLQSEDPFRPRKLRGRFLHITDLHPDPLYLVDASLSSACHRKKPKKEKTRSGYLGTPFHSCDSPLRLTNFTLDHLDKKWTKEIDFVIWTGDNARHDNDRKKPRTPKEIYQLNRNVAKKMEDVFSSKGIPVVPTLGNNDVWPHNILTAGPNSITNEFSFIWKTFIPFTSYQVFQRGAYFSVEVIPGSLAVISLNTMYFYDSNKAVGGCEFKEPHDPGNLQLDWLEVQLDSFRERGLQVWLMGHVPPTPDNFFPECYVRYVEISLRFQDTILGHLFGHMNADHFSFLQADDLKFPGDDVLATDPTTESHAGLDKLLLEDFAALPKNVDHSDYSVVAVAPSVVPNPYLPSFRIYSYNITQAAIAGIGEKKATMKPGKGHHRPGNGTKAEQCKKDKYKETWRCQFSKPWHSDPDSPSRKNGLWTPLGYAQYYMPKLATANKTHNPKFRLEYTTYAAEMLFPKGNQTDFHYPVPLKRLPEALQNNTAATRYTPYGMKDLTISSWVQLAKDLCEPENKKLRRRFKKYMFMGKGGA